MEQPINSGSHYHNYKETAGIALLAMVGSEYKFLFVDVGINGCNTDGGIWDPLKDALEKHELDIIDQNSLPERKKCFVHLHWWRCISILNIYDEIVSQINLIEERQVFNYVGTGKFPKVAFKVWQTGAAFGTGKMSKW